MQKSPPSALCGTILLLPFQSDKQTSKQALRPCKDSETWQVQIRIMPGFWSFPFSIFVELSTIHDCVQDVLGTKAKTPTVPSNVCSSNLSSEVIQWGQARRNSEMRWALQKDSWHFCALAKKCWNYLHAMPTAVQWYCLYTNTTCIEAFACSAGKAMSIRTGLAAWRCVVQVLCACRSASALKSWWMAKWLARSNPVNTIAINFNDCQYRLCLNSTCEMVVFEGMLKCFYHCKSPSLYKTAKHMTMFTSLFGHLKSWWLVLCFQAKKFLSSEW